MDPVTFERRFLKVTKTYAKYSGVWPDQNKFTKYLSWFLMYGITVPAIFMQLARIVHFYSLDIVIEQWPITSATLLLLIKQANYVINSEKLKVLLNGMYADWGVNRPKEELDIMTLYAERGAFLSMFYLVNAYICMVLFIQVPWTARLLYMLGSQNTSPPYLYVIPAYYFIEDDRPYYFYFVIYMSFVILMAVISYVACDTSYTVLVQHACGLLAVAAHRFKNSVSELPLDRQNSEEEIRETIKRVRFSIQAHQRALEFIKDIENTHVSYLFICMGMIIACFSITLVKVVTMEVCADFYKYFSFLIAQLMHLFYLMFQGQFVIDTSIDFFYTICEAPWYCADIKTQMLYVLALRKSVITERLTAGGLVELNMQSFSEVIKMSVSYYTVLRST